MFDITNYDKKKYVPPNESCIKDLIKIEARIYRPRLIDKETQKKG